MAECKWNKDEICVNADCPMVADYCPVPNDPGVCKYEDRTPEESDDTMTDEQIIEVVDRCIAIGEDCENCPFRDYKVCSDKLRECFHDLINRKNAEIERLEKENHRFADIGKMYSEIRAEVIKEFAEKLKKYTKELKIGDNIYLQVVGIGRIDNLVEEMVGDKK